MIRHLFRFAPLCAFALAFAAGPGGAQTTGTAPEAAPPVVSHPVIEPTAPSAGKALNEALVRLARDPRSVDALMAAGQAALALGDTDAALGFFTRADQVNPGQPAPRAAMAGVRLRQGDAVEALHWYAEAEKAGADPATFAADRALAYDLVGDTRSAQPEYRRALDKAAPDSAAHDEAVRRLAISLAIGGDRRAADLALLPLLQRQDRAAWRAHIFVLAIAGRADEAVHVAGQTMPADLAGSIGPYLRFMMRLTPAQQAAVANLGRFPRAADIGRDDPAILAYAAQHPHPAPPPQPVAAPVAVAEAAPPVVARPEHGRKRHGQQAPVPPPVKVAAAPEPEPVLPDPPPPPVLAQAAPAPAAPVVPPVSRTQTPVATAEAPNLPRPAVLSRLDLPPAPRGAAPAPASVPAAQTATPAAADAAAAEARDKAAHDRAAREKAARDAAREKAAKDKLAHEKAEKDRIAREEADALLDPCPPVRHGHTAAASEAPAHGKAAKGHKGAKDKSTRDKSAREKATRGKSSKSAKSTKGAKGKSAKGKADTSVRHGRKGRGHASDEDDRPQRGRHTTRGRHQAAADSDTCAARARGERPDAPTGVSREGEPDDAAPKAKATKGEKADKNTAEKPTKDKAAKGEKSEKDKTAKTDKSDKTDKSEKGDKSGKDKSAKDRKAEKADKAEKSEKGRKARYASRIWVQVLTGADRDKMAGEWRSMVKKARPLKGHKPFITPWRSNYRLLTGPFDSDAEAQSFIAELKKDGVSGFEWTSPAGQAVDSLSLP